MYVLKDILEKKWSKLCEIKKKSEMVVVGSDFFQRNNKGHTDETQVSLRTTLLLCLGVPSEWQVEHLFLLCYLLWNHNNNTTLRTLDSGTNIFAKGHSSVNWKQSLKQQQSVYNLSFETILAAVLDPFTERLAG